MTKSEIQIGHHYEARVSGKLATLRIEQTSTLGGWWARNIRTGYLVRVKSGRRLRRPVEDANAAS